MHPYATDKKLKKQRDDARKAAKAKKPKRSDRPDGYRWDDEMQKQKALGRAMREEERG